MIVDVVCYVCWPLAPVGCDAGRSAVLMHVMGSYICACRVELRSDGNPDAVHPLDVAHTACPNLVVAKQHDTWLRLGHAGVARGLARGLKGVGRHMPVVLRLHVVSDPPLARSIGREPEAKARPTGRRESASRTLSWQTSSR